MNYQDKIHQLSKTLEDFFISKGSIFEEVLITAEKCLTAGRKILVFGNGGSAAQAQHFAAELVNKFLVTRPPLKAIALTTDTSVMSSIGNDTSFELIFSRQIEALGERGDLALALSTSGSSFNIIRAVEAAKKRGLVTVALTGRGGGKLAEAVDFLLDVPSRETPRIQEAHIFILHLIAEKLERQLAGDRRQ